MELSLLCGASIHLIIKEASSGQIATYSSQDDSDLLTSSLTSIQSETYTNNDVTLCANNSINEYSD